MANKAHNQRDKERARDRKEKKKAKKAEKERARLARNHSPPPLIQPPHSPPPVLAAPPSLPPSPLPLRIGDEIPVLDQYLSDIGQRRTIEWTDLDQALIQSLQAIKSGQNGSVFSGQWQGIACVVKVVVVSERKTIPFGQKPDLIFIQNEMMILNYLKNHQNLLENPGAVKVIDVKFVRGALPDVMKGSMPGKMSNQLYFVSVTQHQGSPLTNHKVASLHQFKAIIGQVLVTLGMLERDIRFEHRDLHNNNILVEETGARSIECGIGMVASGGVKVSIIDFTYSRATIGGRRFFLDLGDREDLFKPNPTTTLQMARNEMRRKSGGDWGEFGGGSNACWVKNMGERMILNAGDRSRISRYFMRKWLNKLLKENTVEDMLSLFKRDIFKR